MKLPKDDGSMTHMPFLAPALDGTVVLFFCRAESKAKVSRDTQNDRSRDTHADRMIGPRK